MPVWNIQSIEQTEGWSVREVPLRGLDNSWTRHLIGYSREYRQGQVNSPWCRSILRTDAL